MDRVRMHPSGFKNGAIPVPPPKPPTGPGQGATQGQGVGKGKGIGQGVGGGAVKAASLPALVSAFAAVSSTGVVTGSSPVTPDPFSAIQTLTADGTGSTFDFQNITGNYNHLRIVVVARSAVAATTDQLFVRFNNDSGANYDDNYARGNNSGISVVQAVAQTTGIGITIVAGSTATANYPGIVQVDVPFYANTTFFKQALLSNFGQNDTTATGQNVIMAGGTWRNTAAITRVTVRTSGGANIASGSKAILYGVI